MFYENQNNKGYKVRTWLKEEQLGPGIPWQDEIEAQNIIDYHRHCGSWGIRNRTIAGSRDSLLDAAAEVINFISSKTPEKRYQK